MSTPLSDSLTHSEADAATRAGRLSPHRRLVVKIGSALLVEDGRLKRDWLDAMADDLAMLARAGTELIVVSSGAIALGRGVLKLPRGPLKLEQAQAAASVGQVALAQAYAEALGARGLTAGQVLLTLGDTEERRRYLNARETLGTLLKLGAVPIVNENDTVATSEIRYGDNDRLAARVATMASADCLVLLSDVDGLYTAPPASNPDAVFLPEVPAITAEIEQMAGAAGSELSRGGMRTKIDAAKIATSAGTTMAIASGKRMNPLAHLEAGGRATWFLARSSAGVDRRPPGAARRAAPGRGRDPRRAVGPQPAAGRHPPGGRRLQPRRRSAAGGPGRARHRPRTGRLRPPGGGTDPRPQQPRDRDDPRLCGPGGDGAPGRSRAKRADRRDGDGRRQRCLNEWRRPISRG